jgi:hypothetical protein
MDSQQFRDEAPPFTPFDVEDQIYRVGDVGADGSVRKLDACLQYATRQSRDSLWRRVCVDG